MAWRSAARTFPPSSIRRRRNLASAKANLAKAQSDYDRQRALSQQATTRQDVDAATAALKQAQAQVMLTSAQVVQNSPVPQRIGETESQVGQSKGQIEQAQARLDQADLNLTWTVVEAPQDGWITKRNVEMGNYVAPGQQIIHDRRAGSLGHRQLQGDPARPHAPGTTARIRVDAYPSLDLRGHVDSIQLGSGSKFSAFPAENATGNFVKVVQRVPVKIVIDSGLDPKLPLPLGISVEPEVTVK